MAFTPKPRIKIPKVATSKKLGFQRPPSGGAINSQGNGAFPTVPQQSQNAKAFENSAPPVPGIAFGGGG